MVRISGGLNPFGRRRQRMRCIVSCRVPVPICTPYGNEDVVSRIARKHSLLQTTTETNRHGLPPTLPTTYESNWVETSIMSLIMFILTIDFVNTNPHDTISHKKEQGQTALQWSPKPVGCC